MLRSASASSAGEKPRRNGKGKGKSRETDEEEEERRRDAESAAIGLKLMKRMGVIPPTPRPAVKRAQGESGSCGAEWRIELTLPLSRSPQVGEEG